MSSHDLFTKCSAEPSIVWGTRLGLAESSHCDLGREGMEAQRGEVTWPRSHSEEVPGSRSFFASISLPLGQVSIPGLDTDSQDTVC